MQVEAKADKPAMVKNVKVKIVGNKASVKYCGLTPQKVCMEQIIKKILRIY